MSSEELARCAEGERKFREAVGHQPTYGFTSVERYDELVRNEVGCHHLFCIVVGIYTNNN